MRICIKGREYRNEMSVVNISKFARDQQEVELNKTLFNG